MPEDTPADVVETAAPAIVEPAPVAPEPAPVVATAPEPALEPSPAAIAAPEPAIDYQAEMRAELALTRDARKAVEEIAQRERRARLLANMRRRGATPMLSDAHLLALVPDVDPDTAQGAAAIEAFQTGNAPLFVAAAVARQETAESITAAIPPAPDRKMFGDKFAAGFIERSIRNSKVS